MPLYVLTIFIGAFLLFQVQPLIAKYILPWFGGAPGVWTTCLLFFQLLLLGGYGYAHLSARWFRPFAQAILHLALLGVALALLPIIPADSWKPEGSGNPTLHILALLTVCIGLPYFVLAATGPLLQHWFSRTHPGASPYRLYALSNFGALLALISYPVWFEAQFTREIQARLWGWGFAAYAVGCAACAFRLWKSGRREQTPAKTRFSKPATRKSEPGTQDRGARPAVGERLLWVLLPACASVLLLATTNKMCQEVAVIPFLWVLPLALYLLSFIICFDNPRWYSRLPFTLLLVVAAGAMAWVLLKGAYASLPLQLSVYSAGLFICCMVCHGELYRLRPDARHLTGFYLMIAAGGALGGVLVALVAPLVFNDYLELPWGLLLCVLLLLAVCWWRWSPGCHPRWRWLTVGWLTAGLATLAVLLWPQLRARNDPLNRKSRNFYGVLTVRESDREEPGLWHRVLVHGRTLHGLQFTDDSRAAWPTCYYTENSGVGLAMQALPAGPRRLGMVGLGVGTLAAYARQGDTVHAYEINPQVIELASSRFTFLTNCPGTVELTAGDARLSLEREPPQNFDLLAIDAFDSDAIPVHLLTREAFVVYQRHLKPKGILAVHITNRSLNLEPVVINLARHFNLRVVAVDYAPPPRQWWASLSRWMLLSADGAILDSPALHLAARPLQTNAVSVPLWTDSFASLFQILRAAPDADTDTQFTGTECRLAFELYQRGDTAGALARFRQALQTHPRAPDLLSNLGYLLATCREPSLRNGTEAVQLAEQACQLTHYQSMVLVGTLAAVYAETGRFEDAIWMAQKACAQARAEGDEAALAKNREMLASYLRHEPYREAPPVKPSEP
jgi:hypothetical protein